MEIVTLAIICLMHGTSFALANDRQQVTDTDSQIPEFLFNCQANKVNWISPCRLFRRYLMIFDSKGNFFQEMNNSTYLSTSFTKKAKKPTDDDLIQGRGYPKYLFQLEKVDQHPKSFFIATKSGQLLVAGSEVSPSLMLRKDHCSQVFTDGKLNSSISTTESSVTIANMTTASTELPVTTANTSAVSTESPVTAIAISTPAPNADYSCDQAHWKLLKVEERFLLIESVSKPGFFLNVESDTHKVRLGEDEEKMTGIKTSFLKNMTLERTAGQREPEIGDAAYGDLMVHYFGRNGSQQSGYVCDYDWGKQDGADSVCLYLGFQVGLPTYNGQYSNKITPDYVVSGLKCKDENLEDCEFRTICGSDFNCLAQNSMKPFGGKGFGCNRGATTDIAGLLCGNSSQISKVLLKEVTCNRTSLDNDRKSVKAMYDIKHQMKTVSNKMFANKHWSEYLLPMPMAVSLMSALLLISAQNDRAIELVKPDKGHWDHLKFSYLEPNLLFLAHNIKDNFLLANTNMGVIKNNAISIHENMRQAVEYAFSSNKYDYQKNLPRKIQYISEDAKTNKEKAKEVHTAFKNTAKIIDELITGLENTQSYQKTKKNDAVNAIKQLNNTYVRDQDLFKNSSKLKQEYDANVNESRKDFFDAAKKAMNAKCVNDKECGNCLFEQALKTDCIDWKTICTKRELLCTGGFRDRVCKTWGVDNVCVSEDAFGTCYDHDERDRCREWHDPVCAGWKSLCAEEEEKCIEHKYEPPVSGSYCQDADNYGLCTRCTWADEVKKSLAKVADFTFKMQDSVLNDDRSYSAVADVIGDLVSQVSTIDQDVQTYKKWKATSEIVPPINNATQAMNNESQPISQIDLKQEAMNVEQESKRNINATLKPLYLIKLSVDMSINLLNQEKIPIAIKARNYALELKGLLESLITREVKKVGEMTEKERITVTTLHTKGKAIFKAATKETEKHEISTKKNIPSGGISDHRTGPLATKHMEYLGKRHKTEKVIESLANKMKNAIAEMFKQDFKVQDINSIIIKLTKCSRYLNLLGKAWVLLQDFFDKMSEFLVRQKTNLKRITNVYVDLGIPVNRTELSKSFKDNLKNEIVEALTTNIYVGRIAAFYTKIADDGILTKMASIGLYMKNIKNPVIFDRVKKYVEDEAISIQKTIISEVSIEEAKINDAIMEDVSSIKNDLACKLLDADSISESPEEINDYMDAEEAEEKEENIVATIRDADPDDDETCFFCGVVLVLDKHEKDGDDVDPGEIPENPFDL